MLMRHLSCRFSAALTATLVTLLVTSAQAQDQGRVPDGVASEVAEVKAETAALREQLRRLEEQQQALLELIKALEQQPAEAVATIAKDPPAASAPGSTEAAQPSSNGPQPESGSLMDRLGDHYKDGFVLVESNDGLPFQLKLNHTTQFRYLVTWTSNTLAAAYAVRALPKAQLIFPLTRTGKIDTHLMYSGSFWWEPLGPYEPDGKARKTYDDYFESEKPVIRFGSSFTSSRKDRFRSHHVLRSRSTQRLDGSSTLQPARAVLRQTASST